MPYFVYILKCSDGTYYTGYTGDLLRRLKQHQSGSIPRAYTKPRRPVELVWVGEFETKQEARENEKKIKRWNLDRKENLIAEEKNQTAQIFEKEGGKGNQ
jgi:predicted GIY-YIG superfamily endonuclease